jgi:hypothetical protein
MAERLQDGSIMRWWLPDERNATALSAQSENLGEMKTGFAAMRLGSDASPTASGGMSGTTDQL